MGWTDEGCWNDNSNCVNYPCVDGTPYANGGRVVWISLSSSETPESCEALGAAYTPFLNVIALQAWGQCFGCHDCNYTVLGVGSNGQYSCDTSGEGWLNRIYRRPLPPPAPPPKPSPPPSPPAIGHSGTYTFQGYAITLPGDLYSTGTVFQTAPTWCWGSGNCYNLGSISLISTGVYVFSGGDYCWYQGHGRQGSITFVCGEGTDDSSTWDSSWSMTQGADGCIYDFTWATVYACTQPPSPPNPPRPPPAPPLPPAFQHGVTCSKLTNWWPLNSNWAHGSTVIDKLGAFNGTAFGGYSYSAAHDGAIELDGSTAFVDLGTGSGSNLVFGGGSFSFAFWGRFDNANSPMQRWFDWSNGPNQDTLMMTPTDYSGSVTYQIRGYNPQSTSGAVQSITAGTWNHYALTFEATPTQYYWESSYGTVVLYLNGAAVFSTFSGIVSSDVARSQLLLGRSGTSSDPYLQGALSDFMFSSTTALSALDVAHLYAGVGCPQPSGNSIAYNKAVKNSGLYTSSGASSEFSGGSVALTNNGIVAFQTIRKANASFYNTSNSNIYTYMSGGDPSDAYPWLTVDLGAFYNVSSVQIWNRGDGGDGPYSVRARLGQFQILLGSNAGPPQGITGSSILTFNAACYTQSFNVYLTSVGTYPCGGAGRYLTIQQTGDADYNDGYPSNYMNLNALLVFGNALAAPPPMPPLPLAWDSSVSLCTKITHRWPLNSNYAPTLTAVSDSIGTAAGTAHGGFSYSRDHSGAMVFDGLSSYVDLGNLTFGAPMSVVFWANFASSSTLENVVFPFSFSRSSVWPATSTPATDFIVTLGLDIIPAYAPPSPSPPPPEPPSPPPPGLPGDSPNSYSPSFYSPASNVPSPSGASGQAASLPAAGYPMPAVTRQGNAMQYSLYPGGGAMAGSIPAGFSVTEGVWNMFVLSLLPEGDVNLYVNGTLRLSFKTHAAANMTRNACYLGRGPANNGEASLAYFGGMISDFMLSPTYAFTAADAANLYGNGTARSDKGCPLVQPPPKPPSPPPAASLPPARDAPSANCSRITHRWPLNSAYANGSSVADIGSVGGWNGTAYGNFRYTSSNTGSLTFDGSSVFVDLGNRTFGGALSFVFWAKVDSSDASRPAARFFEFGDGAGHNSIIMLANMDFVVLNPTTYISRDYSSSSTGSSSSSSDSIPTLIQFHNPVSPYWTHYAVTLSASGSVKLFTNGTLKFAASTAAAANASRATLYLGRADKELTVPMDADFVAPLNITLPAGYTLFSGWQPPSPLSNTCNASTSAWDGTTDITANGGHYPFNAGDSASCKVRALTLRLSPR